jgi:hypothetical protein
VKAFAERRFDGHRFPVIMIDGVKYAGETMAVAQWGSPRTVSSESLAYDKFIHTKEAASSKNSS